MCKGEFAYFTLIFYYTQLYRRGAAALSRMPKQVREVIRYSTRTRIFRNRHPVFEEACKLKPRVPSRPLRFISTRRLLLRRDNEGANESWRLSFLATDPREGNADRTWQRGAILKNPTRRAIFTRHRRSGRPALLHDRLFIKSFTIINNQCLSLSPLRRKFTNAPARVRARPPRRHRLVAQPLE